MEVLFSAMWHIVARWIQSLLFDTENEGDIFLRNAVHFQRITRRCNLEDGSLQCVWWK
jgi:hypothetical protein